MSPGPEGLYGLTMAAMASWDMTPKKLWRYGYGKSLLFSVLSFVPLCCPDGLPWLHSVLTEPSKYSLPPS
jgi:hypothetical protein